MRDPRRGGQITDTLVADRSRIAALETQARSEAERLRLIVAVAREIAGSLSLRDVSEAVAKAERVAVGPPARLKQSLTTSA